MAEERKSITMEELERRSIINRERTIWCKDEIDSLWSTVESMGDRIADIDDEIRLQRKGKRRRVITACVSMTLGIVIGKFIGDGTVAYILQRK